MRFPNKENKGMERESERFSQCKKNWRSHVEYKKLWVEWRKKRKRIHIKETIFTSQDANDFPLKEGQAQTHMIYPPYIIHHPPLK